MWRFCHAIQSIHYKYVHFFFLCAWQYYAYIFFFLSYALHSLDCLLSLSRSVFVEHIFTVVCYCFSSLLPLFFFLLPLRYETQQKTCWQQQQQKIKKFNFSAFLLGILCFRWPFVCCKCATFVVLWKFKCCRILHTMKFSQCQKNRNKTKMFFRTVNFSNKKKEEKNGSTFFGQTQYCFAVSFSPYITFGTALFVFTDIM